MKRSTWHPAHAEASFAACYSEEVVYSKKERWAAASKELTIACQNEVWGHDYCAS